MKHKFLTFALMAAFASTMLFSCSNAEEPTPPAIEAEPEGEMVEYTISVNVPDEMRTRDVSTGSMGASGLIEFSNRTINQLWYAYYYDGEYQNTAIVTRTDSNPFNFTVRIAGDPDPSKINFFFWAGNKDDNVRVNSNSSSDIISLRVQEGYVRISPTSLFSKNNLYYYDCFAGYYKLSETNDKSLSKASFTLKRPFAEFHILTDDFMPEESSLYKQYTNGIATGTGFGTFSKKNDVTDLYLPNVWNYKETDSETQNQLGFSNSSTNGTYGMGSYYFSNPLTDENNIFRTSINSRKLDYLTCFYCFAPVKKSKLSYKTTENTIDLNTISMVVIDNQDMAYTSPSFNPKRISIPLPEEGIQANHKYIITDKPRSEGGTGFLNPDYVDYEIIVDNDVLWETTEEHNVDPL